MKTIIDVPKGLDDSSFSFSRRYFHWSRRSEEEGGQEGDQEMLKSNSFSHVGDYLKKNDVKIPPLPLKLLPEAKSKSKKKTLSISKLRTVLLNFTKSTRSSTESLSTHLGSRVVGTLFGYRRGHVHFALQHDSKVSPAFLIELATPTATLVKEMASGLVRIALECDRMNVKKSTLRLVEEPIWRVYCNGKKCGFGLKRECCKSEEWIGKVLQAVEKVSMGAGVLPGDGCELGELMYMRAKFERVVGSRDSEAYYMMNPNGCGGPELSIYLLRV